MSDERHDVCGALLQDDRGRILETPIPSLGSYMHYPDISSHHETHNASNNASN